eukprot:TRINITY_DN2462_c0_g1_i11.p1 TRINITY_DN2462_c0_g1~~TRINITY_DN2462_c0_g1_i11.p1  ORF type:complete len:189 (+),score=11.47 TRINITY_DN2462_c0_g1_i11:186-752(+)
MAAPRVSLRGRPSFATTCVWTKRILSKSSCRSSGTIICLRRLASAAHRKEKESMNTQQSIESNKQTVTRFLELFSSGDVENTMAMFTEDATWWVAGTMPISGTYDKAQFTKLLSGVLDTCTGPIQIKPLAFTVEGERVALEAESYTQTKNGRTYNNFYHFLFKVREGKIAGVKEFLDTMHTNAVLCTP